MSKKLICLKVYLQYSSSRERAENLYFLFNLDMEVEGVSKTTYK